MANEITAEILLAKMKEAQAKAMEQYSMTETDTRWLAPFLGLMWLTGGRVSEVLKLRGRDLQDYEVDGKRVVVVSLVNLKQRGGKGKVKESLIVPDQYPEIWSYVEAWWREHPVGGFFSRNRKTVWYHCNRLFNRGTHRVGRHSWVMEKARRGVPILDVKQQGGWRKLDSMTQYVHVFGRKEMARRLLKTTPADD